MPGLQALLPPAPVPAPRPSFPGQCGRAWAYLGDLQDLDILLIRALVKLPGHDQVGGPMGSTWGFKDLEHALVPLPAQTGAGSRALSLPGPSPDPTVGSGHHPVLADEEAPTVVEAGAVLGEHGRVGAGWTPAAPSGLTTQCVPDSCRIPHSPAGSPARARSQGRRPPH